MEQMLPSAMVPGLVTIKDSKGKTQNVFPIDAKELISSGAYTLVDNGSAEAARLNTNPLRSGRAVADTDVIVAEIAGIAGSVIVASDAAAAEKVKDAGDNADEKASTAETAPAAKAPAPAAKAPATSETKQ